MSIHFGSFNGVDLAFDEGDVFYDDEELVVRNAKNVSDCTDERLPNSIPLDQIEMEITERAGIIMRA